MHFFSSVLTKAGMDTRNLGDVATSKLQTCLHFYDGVSSVDGASGCMFASMRGGAVCVYLK